MVVDLFGMSKNATTWIMVALLAVVVIVVIVLPMFTNKKRNKAVNELHNSLCPGDVIKTVGGIVGTIKAINEISPVDKEMIVETGVGDNKSTLVFDIQAVYQVVSKINPPAPAATEVKTEDAVAKDAVAEEVKAEDVTPVVEDDVIAADEAVEESKKD